MKHEHLCVWIPVQRISLKVTMTGTVYCPGPGCLLRVVDGTGSVLLDPMCLVSGPNAHYFAASYTGVVTGVGAGPVTLKIQFRNDTAGYTTSVAPGRGGEATPFCLLVEEH